MRRGQISQPLLGGPHPLFLDLEFKYAALRRCVGTN
jgi:hypothetical protein